jgi:hypothetical protein
LFISGLKKRMRNKKPAGSRSPGPDFRGGCGMVIYILGCASLAAFFQHKRRYKDMAVGHDLRLDSDSALVL